MVDAGPRLGGNEGAAVNLYGSAVDDNGSVSTTWSYTAGADVDPGTTCSFGNPNAPRTTFTCTDDGEFTLTLTGSDGVNAAVSDTTTVTLQNVPPRIPA
ncbi:hypothetical protein [Micromonospora sp. U21]|uniref:PKD domain-containing protein n=1 Tax=Micromonospora sp. U21 TaxID=2824899 RepID=UPI001B39898F|nr:hypothetical protein [Micromonospora sp. U21]MBQ0904549.1 hypothetical protein [Micromonospora sp. U21]